MSVPSRLVLVSAVLLAAANQASGAAPDKPAVADLAARAREDGVSVSFRVESAFPADASERLASGIELEFRHRVEVYVRRAVPLWPARVLARVDLFVSVRYDSLTRQYYLTRRVLRERDGKEVEGEPSVEDSTSSRAEAERWMTAVESVVMTLPPAEADERERRLRVRSSLGRRYRFYLFPMAESAEAEQEIPR